MYEVSCIYKTCLIAFIARSFSASLAKNHYFSPPGNGKCNMLVLSLSRFFPLSLDTGFIELDSPFLSLLGKCVLAY